MRRGEIRPEGPQGGLRGAEEAGVIPSPFPYEDADNDEYQYGHAVGQYHVDGEGDL